MAFGVVREIAPRGAIHSPIEIFVTPSTEMRSPAEVIARGRAERLHFGLHEGLERFLLRSKLAQHCDFKLALSRHQGVWELLAIGEGEELVGSDTTGVGVIAGELEKLKV